MAAHLQASMPQLLDLGAGYTLRVTALDPTTGATVTGVRATDVAFQVRPLVIGAGGEPLTDLPFPLLVPSDQLA